MVRLNVFILCVLWFEFAAQELKLIQRFNVPRLSQRADILLCFVWIY